MTIEEAISQYDEVIANYAASLIDNHNTPEVQRELNRQYQLFVMGRNALHTQQEQPNEPLDKIARAIIEIVGNGGCPPNKNCTRNQNCNQCYIEWLRQTLPPFQQEPNKLLTLNELCPKT